ncbi:Hypothetical protein CINCED_3A001390 [Cinara cedri]|uniref:Uncharacterized protein n=1 Tax=Cinara cedri TaxID=506608 RepID=A0A5E4N3K2_9HEMI|nr:Hypothetical protein CINCED_3A001390 [Cinara cedri]
MSSCNRHNVSYNTAFGQPKESMMMTRFATVLWTVFILIWLFLAISKLISNDRTYCIANKLRCAPTMWFMENKIPETNVSATNETATTESATTESAITGSADSQSLSIIPLTVDQADLESDASESATPESATLESKVVLSDNGNHGK